MGGRGSLSSRKHTMYDKESIKEVMRRQNIRVVGINKLDNRGLSLVVEAMETIQELEKKYGKHIDSVAIGLNRKSTLSYNDNLVVKVRGKEVSLGRTLVIPKDTVKKGKSALDKKAKKESKKNMWVAQNTKQAIMHEYGHAMHQNFKRKYPELNKNFEKEFKKLVTNPKSRVHLSTYATNKKYNGKITSSEYVAESLTHLMRNTKDARGQEMINLVRKHFEKAPGIDFGMYGIRKYTKKIKKKPKK